MKKKVGIIKRLFCLLLIFLLSINSFAAIVSDNDGSAFITKAEFDALKSSFQAQIDSYNQSIDSKIDGAIASYLSGIQLAEAPELLITEKLGKLKFINNPPSDTTADKGHYDGTILRLHRANGLSALVKGQAAAWDETWSTGTSDIVADCPNSSGSDNTRLSMDCYACVHIYGSQQMADALSNYFAYQLRAYIGNAWAQYAYSTSVLNSWLGTMLSGTTYKDQLYDVKIGLRYWSPGDNNWSAFVYSNSASGSSTGQKKHRDDNKTKSEIQDARNFTWHTFTKSQSYTGNSVGKAFITTPLVIDGETYNAIAGLYDSIGVNNHFEYQVSSAVDRQGNYSDKSGWGSGSVTAPTMVFESGNVTIIGSPDYAPTSGSSSYQKYFSIVNKSGYSDYSSIQVGKSANVNIYAFYNDERCTSSGTPIELKLDSFNVTSNYQEGEKESAVLKTDTTTNTVSAQSLKIAPLYLQNQYGKMYDFVSFDLSNIIQKKVNYGQGVPIIRIVGDNTSKIEIELKVTSTSGNATLVISDKPFTNCTVTSGAVSVTKNNAANGTKYTLTLNKDFASNDILWLNAYDASNNNGNVIIQDCKIK